MFSVQPRCDPELFNIAYGVYVAKLLKEAPNKDAFVVNCKLEAIGYNMGKRLIDHFFAYNDTVKSCKEFEKAMGSLRVAFIQFLGVNDVKMEWVKEKISCRLLMLKNPLGDFFALPTGYQSSLWYSNILCGLIRGALEMINMKVKATFVSDNLRLQAHTEILVQLEDLIQDRYDSDEEN